MYVILSAPLFDDPNPLVWADGSIYPKIGWTNDIEKAHLYRSKYAAECAIEQLKYNAYPEEFEKAKHLFTT